MTDSGLGQGESRFILEVRGLCKSFGALKALDNVDVQVTSGSIHGIIGPNGSGKTTLFDCITGLLRSDHGKVLVDGKDVTGERPEIIARGGVRRTFQDARLVGGMTVLENVMAGDYGSTARALWDVALRPPFVPSRREAQSVRTALELLDNAGMKESAHREASSLTWSERQIVQIVRALVGRPRLLLLDEPAAGMGINESDRMAGLIREVRQGGATVVVVSHDVKLLMSVSDTVTVLSFGKQIASGTPGEVREDPRVLEAYLGEA